MIDFENWKKNVYRALHDIADKKFQQQAWLGIGIGDFISSPEEVYCYLIDDNLLEEFLEYPELNYNAYQKQQAHQFIKDFDDYYDSQPGEYLNAQKIIDDPKWHVIGQKALKLIDTLDLGKYKNTNE